LLALQFIHSLIRSRYHVSKNIRGIFASELLRKRNHAILFPRPAEHYIKPLFVRQGLRVAQIRHHSSAYRHVAVAGRAVALEYTLASFHRGFVGRRRGRIQRERSRFNERRQGRLATKFENEHAADISHAARFESYLTDYEWKCAATTRRHRNVLFAVHGVADGARHHSCLRCERPELLAGVGAISFEVPARGPFEYEI